MICVVNAFGPPPPTYGMSDDIGLDEKRVYADREEATTAFVAAGAGVARVEVSADIVGEFALQRRCTARDVAASAGRLAVATAEDDSFDDRWTDIDTLDEFIEQHA